MANIAYIRVSTEEQNEERQIQQMPPNIDKFFADHSSGKSCDGRPALKDCLAYLRDGDTLYVESISRFARNTRDLLSMVEELQRKGVEFVSLKERVDTTTPQGRFILTIWGAMAEMEREQILERQREGIEIARKKGVYTGRKPISVDERALKRVVERWRRGDITAREAMRCMGLKSATFYRRVHQLDEQLRDREGNA